MNYPGLLQDIIFVLQKLGYQNIQSTAYLLLSLLSMKHSFWLNSQKDVQQVFWFGLSLLLIVLATNKYFDLLGSLVIRVRDLMELYDWYNQRKPLQLILIAINLLGLVGGTGLIVRRFIFNNHPSWLSLLLVLYVTDYAIIKSISFHDIDQVLYQKFTVISLSSSIELALFILLTGSVYRAIVWDRRFLVPINRGN